MFVDAGVQNGNGDAVALALLPHVTGLQPVEGPLLRTLGVVDQYLRGSRGANSADLLTHPDIEQGVILLCLADTFARLTAPVDRDGPDQRLGRRLHDPDHCAGLALTQILCQLLGCFVD